MGIDQIKTEIKSYTDYFGSRIINVEDVDKCTSKEQLAELIDYHHDFIESMATDAQSSLSRFKQKLGLHNL